MFRTPEVELVKVSTNVKPLLYTTTLGTSPLGLLNVMLATFVWVVFVHNPFLLTPLMISGSLVFQYDWTVALPPLFEVAFNAKS